MKWRKQFAEMFKELLAQASGQWPLISLSAAAIVAISVLEFWIPQFTKIVIDQFIPNRRYDALLEMGGCIVGAALLLGAFRFCSSYMMTLVSQRAILRLRNKLYRHTLSLDLKFFERNRTGDLMTRLTSDVNQLQELVSAETLSIAADFFTFTAVCGYLLYVDWELALLLMSTFPFLFYTSRFFSGRIKSAYRTVRQSSAELSNHLQDTLSGIRMIKSFANEHEEVQRFAEWSEQNRNATVTASRLSALFSPIVDVLNSIGMVFVLLFGAWQAMRGRLTVGDIVVFLAYLRLLQGPIRSFSRMVSRIQQSAAAYERIHEVLKTVPEIRNKDNAIALPAIQGDIFFDDVDFAYEANVPVLQNFHLRIRANQVTALVGSSGSGKSTVAHLIARLYDVQKGVIFIDGHPLDEVTLESLRRQIGIVSQDVILLNGTIRENIAYGRPDASPEEIEAAARAANAQEFIEAFPHGYDTLIGERGVKLSGGQKQRLSIARALLKNPRSIILDEATAALDTESEQLIQKALSRLLPGRTCLVIAHRLSTIQHADRIVVLEKGQVVETGTHEALLRRSGRYKTLYDMQFPQIAIETA
ncbi:ATP-binding cassette, subfamily B, MsbA [Paenibacillus tianmuensis]|uniref:ATP-binding cassette, subfamily B, MsbA n=1 Tax=Paenibacillus tianmuensis TaxID=624147 RepID=A0A1G4SHC6_9BACL|nr:ABC transporter ATP-binding protein [Paenibacillus tianmuensis]SCW68451.1 ATP-binding cassette, subfamily B, MsbA [Paenibacillus tianmuensis]